METERKINMPLESQTQKSARLMQDISIIESDPKYAHFEECRRIIENCKKKTRMLFIYNAFLSLFRGFWAMWSAASVSYDGDMTRATFTGFAMAGMMVLILICSVFTSNKSKTAHYIMAVLYLLPFIPQFSSVLAGRASVMIYLTSIIGIVFCVLSYISVLKHESTKDMLGYPYFNVRFAAQELERGTHEPLREYGENEQPRNTAPSPTNGALAYLNQRTTDPSVFSKFNVKIAPQDFMESVVIKKEENVEKIVIDENKREIENNSVADVITKMIDPSRSNAELSKLENIKPPMLEDMYSSDENKSRRYSSAPLPSVGELFEK